jgi:hypothetical protein
VRPLKPSGESVLILPGSFEVQIQAECLQLFSPFPSIEHKCEAQSRDEDVDEKDLGPL